MLNPGANPRNSHVQCVRSFILGIDVFWSSKNYSRSENLVLLAGEGVYLHLITVNVPIMTGQSGPMGCSSATTEDKIMSPSTLNRPRVRCPDRTGCPPERDQ